MYEIIVQYDDFVLQPYAMSSDILHLHLFLCHKRRIWTKLFWGLYRIVAQSESSYYIHLKSIILAGFGP